MIDWVKQKIFTDCSFTTKEKSAIHFPLNKVWHADWYLMIQDMVLLTLFQEDTKHPHIPTGYLMATMSSVPYCEAYPQQLICLWSSGRHKYYCGSIYSY